MIGAAPIRFIEAFFGNLRALVAGSAALFGEAKVLKFIWRKKGPNCRDRVNADAIGGVWVKCHGLPWSLETDTDTILSSKIVIQMKECSRFV